MKNILLSGGAGFIASTFYNEYKMYYNIKIIDNFNDFYNINQKLENLNLKNISDIDNIENVFYGDILDFDYVEYIVKNNKFDCIIHAAAYPGVRTSFKYPYDYYKNNTMGTLNLIELCRKYSIKKFIFLSSSSVYGENEIPFNENMEKRPISIYASSKDIAEDILEQYQKHFDIDIIVLRLFTVYGPRQRPDLMLYKFIKNALLDKENEVYDINSSRDYTFIKDAVNAIDLTIKYLKQFNGFEIINIGSSKSIRMQHVLTVLKDLINNFKYQIKEPVRGDLKQTLADIKKARNILGYNPQYTFEQGVEGLYQWLKEKYVNK